MSKSKKQMKTTAILMPATREQAEQLLHEIGSLQREVVKIEANMNDKLAGIKKQFELFAQPLNQQIENKFQALHIWAEANRSALLKGKSKTVKLATGELLWRTRPPHVSLPKNQDTVVQALISADLGHLVRTKQEVNKDAVLDDVDAVKGIAGIKIKRREEFVAKPFESQIERAEPVKTEVKAA